LRELAREVWIALLTQPFLPLFYVLGHRMDAFFVRRGEEGLATARARVPIVFVHGYMQNRVGFFGLARALARQGLGPMFGFNYPWFGSMASNAKRLDRFVARICKETGAAAVDLVCHSMGGLVAMEMMRDEAQREKLKVRRCVTIATPHAGIVWRGPLVGFGATSLRRGSKLLAAHAGAKLAVPCLSVYSTHDNIVHPKESSSLSVRGGRDVEVDGLAHLAILFSPKVAEHVAAFLAEPDPV
jgi:pimeloyl-ACP methyl ester carboxylesterase